MTLGTRAFFWLFLGLSSMASAQVHDLRLNQIQVKGTHNSYHQQSLIAFHPSHKYTHLSLTDQLEKRGIRAFELDVHRPSFGSNLLVYHIAVIDAKTSCKKFKDCLQELKNWSDQHPDHVTIFVWIEIKDATGGPKFANFDRVDEEIRDVLGDQVLTPDAIQKNYESLQAAVQQEGWPQIAETRGKFMFMLDQDERNAQVYLRNDSLQGRAMFVRASEETLNSPWAVVTKTGPGSFHAKAMQKNFIVSENICSPELTAAECYSKLENARVAGTHILMDDFEGDEKKQSNGDYYIRFDVNSTANCNPQTASMTCNSFEIDQESFR